MAKAAKQAVAERRAKLGERKVTHGSVTVAALPPAERVGLRAPAASVAALSKALGVKLPGKPKSSASEGGRHVLWLGPDEWLAVGAPGAADGLVARLSDVLAGRHAAVVDVTGNRTRLRLSGPGARDCLAKGCALDLHPRAFGPGHCAQTGLARAAILLHQLDDAPSYDLYPRRSFTDYVWTWLADAIGEFGGRTEGR